MSKSPGAPKVANLNDLLAVAYQIEIDAVDRYKLLADQMETHNNPELTKIFRDLARAEGIHGEEIRRMAGDFDVAAPAREIAQLEKSESPERRGTRFSSRLPAKSARWPISPRSWRTRKTPR
jgi:rubrerythrin